MRSLLYGFATVCVLTPCHAQEPEHPDLPPTAQVEAALSAHPEVLAARLGVREQEANSARLSAGGYEYAVRLGAQQRHVDDPADRFTEWDVGLERPLRFGRKSAIDADIGAQGIEVARNVAYNAWCTNARELLRMWFTWMRERAQLDIWQRQITILREQPAMIDKRVRAGDAPRMEHNLAQASLLQAEAQLAQLYARELSARRDLVSTYQGVTPPEALPESTPVHIEEPLEYFLDRTFRFNDEIATARATTRLRSLGAERAAADLTPDPTVGIRYASERGGAETIAGLYLSIPIGGKARGASRTAADAIADIAAQHQAATQRRLAAEVSGYYTAAQGSFAASLKASEAAQAMQRNAQSVQRGYELGEMQLVDLHTAQRLALEAEVNAALARLDASENRYRLMIEAHLLWEDPEEKADH